jgi:hypothetical protein
MQVVKHEEKEAMLFRFILEEVADGRVAADGEWSIVALSMQSPVIAAVRRVVTELEEVDRLALRVVLTGRDAEASNEGFMRLASLNVRHAFDLRLLDAHEQLVLSQRSAWCGDCMRRNPSQRDAFESFLKDDPVLSGWARKTFDRLWASAQDIPISGVGAGEARQDQDADGFIAAGEAKPSTILAATSRH